MTPPLRLTAPGCQASFDPADGGRLISLRVWGHELLVGRRPDAFHWGSFALAPWVGTLRDATVHFDGAAYRLPANRPPWAVHGLVTERPWRVDGDGQLSIEIGEPWPWHCRLTQRTSLTDSAITFDLRLESDTSMPAAIGWHPWFARRLFGPDGRAVEIELDLQPRLMWASAPDSFPTGELSEPAPRPWDHCFRDLAAPPVLRWPGLLQVTVTSTCSEWVCYEHPDGICVEPWTAPPNSLNMPAPFVVTPGCPLTASMTWTWCRLS